MFGCLCSVLVCLLKWEKQKHSCSLFPEILWVQQQPVFISLGEKGCYCLRGEKPRVIFFLWVGSFLPGPFLSSPSFLSTETTHHSGSFSSLCDWLCDHWEACHSLLRILFTVKLWYCGMCRIKINFLIKSCNDPPFKALHFVCSLLAAALLVNFFCIYFQFFFVPMIYTHRFSVITNLAFISCWVVYLDLFLVIFCG